MSVVDALTQSNQAAMRVAGVLEQALGGEVVLAVGLPKTEPPSADNLPASPLRMVSASFTGSESGIVAVLVDQATATALEALAPDEAMTTSLAPVVSEAAAIVTHEIDGGARAGVADERDPSELAELPDGTVFVVYPLLDGTARVAAFVVAVGAPLEAVDAGATLDVTLHEFQPISGAASERIAGSHALTLLQDVEMGVTAELGRRRMTIRELLGLTPGAVIELDRAAGSPVDVLVNGTLIARGEVVVIDEEFGIRISEIVADGTGATVR
jgi:flagellar motor switch protein FliN/FliY